MALEPNINVQVDADTARALADILIFAKEADAALSSVGSDVSFNKDKEANEGGQDAGQSFWKGYGKEDSKGSNAATGRFKRLLTKWSAIVASFGETIGVALYGAGGALASLSASLVQAIGAAGAFVPIAAGIGAALATIVIGSAGVKDGFAAVNEEIKTAVKEGRAFNGEAEGITKALEGLTPAAKEFVLAFAGLGPQLQDLRTSIQEGLFTGLGEALTDLGTKQLPDLQTALVGVAGSLNSAFLDLITTVNSFNLGEILTDLTPTIDNVFGALAPLSAAFLSFLSAATPAAERLSLQFSNWALRLAEFTQSADGTVKIQEFLDRSLTSLNSWLDLIGSIGTAFGSFMEIAASSGDSLIDSLTGVVDKFDEWINKNPETILAFLETSERIVKSLGPLLEGLVGFFDNLVSEGAVGRFEDLAATLGEILPLLGSILEAAGEAGLLNIVADAILAIGEAIESSGLLDAFRDLATTLGDGLGQIVQRIVDSGILETLGEGLAAIALVIVDVLDALMGNDELWQAFEDGLVAIGDALTAVGPAFLQIISNVALLIPSLIPLLDLLPPLADLIVALAPAINLLVAASTLWLTISTTLMQFFQGVLIGVITAVIDILTALTNVITGAVIAAVEGLSSAWQATTEDISEFYERNIAPLVEKITGVFTGIKDGVLKAWGELTQGITDLWNRNIQPFLTAIPGKFQAAWDTIRGGFSDFIGFFTGLWDDAKGAWDDTLEDLRQFGRDAVSFFSELPGRITTALSDVKDAIVEPFKAAWEKAKEYVDKIKNLPGTIAGGIGGAVNRFNPFADNNARGAIVTQATKMIAGEAGAEAVIPLTRPLSQIDPSVRMMAALLRGEGPKQQQAQIAPSRGERMVNNWVINDRTGNAEATAQKVINRLALV